MPLPDSFLIFPFSLSFGSFVVSYSSSFFFLPPLCLMLLISLECNYDKWYCEKSSCNDS